MLNIENSKAHIQEVEVPAFLFTRIRAKIEELKPDTLSWKQVTIGFAAVVVLVVFNVLLFTSKNDSPPTSLVVDEPTLIYGS